MEFRNRWNAIEMNTEFEVASMLRRLDDGDLPSEIIVEGKVSLQHLKYLWWQFHGLTPQQIRTKKILLLENIKLKRQARLLCKNLKNARCCFDLELAPIFRTG